MTVVIRKWLIHSLLGIKPYWGTEDNRKDEVRRRWALWLDPIVATGEDLCACAGPSRRATAQWSQQTSNNTLHVTSLLSSNTKILDTRERQSTPWHNVVRLSYFHLWHHVLFGSGRARWALLFLPVTTGEEQTGNGRTTTGVTRKSWQSPAHADWTSHITIRMAHIPDYSVDFTQKSLSTFEVESMKCDIQRLADYYRSKEQIHIITKYFGLWCLYEFIFI